jgi:hypothetical protein
MLSSLLYLQLWIITTYLKKMIQFVKPSQDERENMWLISRKKDALFKIIVHIHSDAAVIIIPLLHG